VLALCALVGVTVGISRPSQRDVPKDLKPGRIKICQNLLTVAYRSKALVISCCDGRDMPIVAPTIVLMATFGKLDAES
jgi:hypothetical protein